MKTLLILFLTAASLLAQTTLYVPTGTTYCIKTATNATPIVITTAGCDNTSLASATPTAVNHGWTNGTVIVIAGVEGNTAANGTRVATNVTATTAELYDLGASPVAGNGAFERYTGGQGTSYPTVASGTEVTLKDHPRVWLDGPAGALTSTLCTGGGACKAVAGNPAYMAMKTSIDTYVTPYSTTSPPVNLIGWMQGGDFGYLGGLGLMYQSTGDTSYRDKAIGALNNIDKYTKGFGCLEEISGCGDSITLDYASKYLWNIAQTYSIVRSSMTAGERAAFAGKMLNDKDDSCTNRFYAGSGTVNYTLYTTTITGNGTQWLTNADTAQRIAVGDSIMYTTGCTSGYCSGMTMIVSAVNSDTSLTIQGYPTGGFVSGNVTAGPYWIGKPWASGNCGLVNFIKHSGFSPLSSGKTHPSIQISGVYSNFGGTTVYSRDESNRSELYNQNITKGLGFLALAIALADDDPRALAMIQRLMFWWKDFWYPYSRAWTTGAMQITPKYYATRVQPFTADFAIQLRNSFVESSMDFTGGTWLKTPLSLWVYGYSRAPNAYTRWAYPAPVTMTADHWKGGLASAYLQPSVDEAKAWRYILQNWTGYYGPGVTEFAYANMLGYPGNYLYTDPTATTADPNTTLPLSRNLTVSDTGTLGEGTGLVLSRTGWLADSSIFEIHAISDLKFANLWANSYAGDPASYKIFKRHYLLAEDYGKGIQPTFSAYCAPNEQSNFMRIGPYASNSASLLQRANFKSQIQYVKTPRYWNDSGDHATYAMVDYAGAYQSGAQITFAHRHYAHFKKTGTSEYVIVADAVRTSGGQHKITYLHYPNNGQTGWFENGNTPWPANGTEGNTTITGDSIVSSAPSSRILTKVLRPGGATSLRVYTDNPDGSYTGAVDPAKGPLGGAGQTFRVSICASADGSTCDTSNLKTNVLVAHRVVDGTTETANPVDLLSSIDPNFIGAQVDDGASSIVAVFPADGSTLASASFTSTHSGTGQYLVSGLTEGTWSIYKNGSVVDASAAVDSSGALYWEGTAGAYVLTRTGAGALSVSTSSLPNGTQNASYSFPLAAVGGTAPYTWAVTVGSLPAGITLSSAGLLSGTPTGTGDSTFTVQVTDADTTTDTKEFTLTVSAATVTPTINLTLSPASLAFQAINGGANPANQTLTFTSSAPIANWSRAINYTNGSGWLTVTPTSGTTAANLTVAVNISGLAVGTYCADVVVSSTDPDVLNSPQTSEVCVEVLVTPGPYINLTLSPATVSFTANQGGGTTPDNQTLAFSTNAAIANWSRAINYTDGSGWLTAIPASGTTAVNLTLTVDPTGLEVGTYCADVVISSADPDVLNSPQTSEVCVTVPPVVADPLAPSVRVKAIGALIEVRYGRAGLTNSTQCVVSAAGTTYTDSGGPASRVAYLTVSPSTSYTVRVDCTGSFTETTITSGAEVTGTASFSIQIGASPYSHAALDYSTDGSSWTSGTPASCVSGCTLTASGLTRGTPYWVRIRRRDASNDIVIGAARQIVVQ